MVLQYLERCYMLKITFVIYGWDNRKHKEFGNKLYDSEIVNQWSARLPKGKQDRHQRAYIQALQGRDSKAKKQTEKLFTKICRDRAIQKDRDTKKHSSWMLGDAQKNRKDYRKNIHHEDDKGSFRWVSKYCLGCKLLWFSNEIT